MRLRLYIALIAILLAPSRASADPSYERALKRAQYLLNSTTPTNLDQVAFSITPTTASVVKAQLASGGSWYTCTNTTGSVTCNTTSPQATAAAATQLTVVAAQ